MIINLNIIYNFINYKINNFAWALDSDFIYKH